MHVWFVPRFSSRRLLVNALKMQSTPIFNPWISWGLVRALWAKNYRFLHSKCYTWAFSFTIVSNWWLGFRDSFRLDANEDFEWKIQCSVWKSSFNHLHWKSLVWNFSLSGILLATVPDRAANKNLLKSLLPPICEAYMRWCGLVGRSLLAVSTCLVTNDLKCAHFR